MALPSETKGAALHGFCDASIKAYGCAIYLRYTDADGALQSRLLCSKSRVAPLKQLTLPKLELQAALLLAELYVRIKDVFNTRIKKTSFWTDSQVALAWIRSDNTRWEIFVKNRVQKIHAATNQLDWHYVPTKLNPADIVSRGLPVSKLVNDETMRFWLNGPDFIIDDETPQSDEDDPVVLEERESPLQLLTATVGPACDDLVAQYKYHNSFGPMQHLNPVVKDNLIYVKGRLGNAEMTDEERLPILLPKSHPFTRTILRHLHEYNFHAGTELVMSEFRTRFWMRDLRRTVIGVIAKCKMHHHFGGLWEANIKVAKRLFKAAAKGAQLNLVELQTLLHQITSILNSRPLTAIDATPGSIEALTPAHFLIGRASFAVPATVVDDDTDGVKTRWKRVQKLAQQFWHRWQAEYR
uniref:Integrase_H2C2 domain-containing protein n=1 Tax=Anopheles epiroticus TaxID=199890 RepID=A0A182PWV7_9DIPT